MGFFDNLKQTYKENADAAARNAEVKKSREERRLARAEQKAVKQEAKRLQREEQQRQMELAIAKQTQLQAMFTPTKDFSGVSIDENHGLIKANAGFLNTVYLKYDEITGYELIENGSQISKGGLGMAVVGGALFGGVGAIAGSVIGKKKGRAMVENLILQINTSDINNPCVSVKYITTSTRVDSFTYKMLSKTAREAAATLQIIIDNQQPVQYRNQQQVVSDPYEELKKLKELLDLGIITQAEFDAKKGELL